jgi:hypothetical protein
MPPIPGLTPSLNPISLRQRVLKAGAWTLAGFGASQVIRFGSNLLMTRLLVPEMFGVMAVANVVMVGLSLFSDIGLPRCDLIGVDVELLRQFNQCSIALDSGRTQGGYPILSSSAP